MLDYQFVNNRIFDALACGLPVISDYCEELKEIFPDAVLYYNNKEEFDNYTRILYQQARLIEGLPVDNPTELTNLICNVISK